MGNTKCQVGNCVIQVASDPFTFALLQHSAQGKLGVRRQFTDFIRKDGAAICQLKPAQLLRGSGVSSFS